MQQWTAPDAFEGDVSDPRTQSKYMWNNDNPIAYSDPSGYSAQDVMDLINSIAMGAFKAFHPWGQGANQTFAQRLSNAKGQLSHRTIKDAAYQAVHGSSKTLGKLNSVGEAFNHAADLQQQLTNLGKIINSEKLEAAFAKESGDEAAFKLHSSNVDEAMKVLDDVKTKFQQAYDRNGVDQK
jgi:hypothetical protein